MKRFRREAGFTLVELMITVVVVAILLSIAAPSFFSIINENRARTQTSRLVASFNAARVTAAKENQPATVCASANSTSCSGDKNDFKKSWIVFVDEDADRAVDGGTDEIVRVEQGIPDVFELKFERDLPAITYFPDGSAHATQVIMTCPPDLDNRTAWGVIVNAVGSPRMKRATADDPNDIILSCS